VLSKESQGIPADQARFTASLLTSENQILNKQRQALLSACRIGNCPELLIVVFL
jgi:hypothetical protein